MADINDIKSIEPQSSVRPWGGFRVFAKNVLCTVKILTVRQGQRLSDQRHARRTEHWRVISGVAHVELEFADGRTETHDLDKGQEITIPVGTWHRLSCRQGVPNPCEVLEVATGDFDEEDIERRSDDYGRVGAV